MKIVECIAQTGIMIYEVSPSSFERACTPKDLQHLSYHMITTPSHHMEDHHVPSPQHLSPPTSHHVTLSNDDNHQNIKAAL